MRSPSPTMAVVAAAAVLVLAVLASAVGGTWQLQPRDLGFDAPSPPPQEVVTQEPVLVEVEEALSPARDPVDLRWLRVAGRVLLLVLAGLAAWWVWLRVRHLRPARPAPQRSVGEMATVEVQPDVPVLRRGVAAAQRFLDDIPLPADAIIAAWLALEDAAAASGVRRGPAQTPTEFTAAVLDRTDVDPQATARLLALYHRARFSRQPIAATDVAEASACLRRLAEGWEALDRAAPPGAAP